MPTLITGYLEHISSKVFDDYHAEITQLVGRQHGVYALYKKNKLYYVGLARNLRRRVKQHLQDRHANKWDRFSLYLIHNIAYLKELEALILHIAEPKGNMQKGRLGKGDNFVNELRRLVIQRDKQRVEKLFGGKKKFKSYKAKHRSRSTRRDFAPKGPILHKLLFPGTSIKAYYKGKEHFAKIDEQGKIVLNGKVYNSPSTAGKSLVDRRTVNGWRFWKYQNKNGKWVHIGELLER